MRIAMLGGTFDPVHLGHLLMADEVLARLEYDQVRFVPARIPPHKPDQAMTESAHRLRMLELATAGRDEFVVDDFEVRSEGVSYTVRTLRHLISDGKIDGRPGLIIGEDLVEGFERWHEADAIEELADIILVRRPGQPETHFSRRHILLDNLMIGISSTEIRERLVSGLPTRYLLAPAVFAYIEEQGLYRESGKLQA
jgi:nicotinate-nucleotide adenylyltransferase